MNTSPALQPGLRLRLFGGCDFQRSDKIVRLETTKTTALLAYLALQSAPQPRHKLMGLFWGSQPEAHARRNLRHALWNIRQQFSGLNPAPLIQSDLQTVGWNHSADVWLDVRAFERALQSEAEITPSAGRPEDRYALLREAIDLYRGDLLDGVFVDDAPAFEEWLLVERERLRAQAVDALHRLITYYVSWGEYDSGLDYAGRLLEMEPWLEEAHRQMMRLLALSGRRSAALAQYETCRRVLAEELNAQPSPETQALCESIRVGAEETQPSHVSAPLHHLPPQATPFVGRAEELARLAALLREPACRLITLVGPGGVGKTRLAIRAAADADAYRDGVFFVPLVGVGSADLLVWAIADAIGLAFQGGENPRAVLLDHLRQQNVLLLMDNLEHLVAGADLLAEILQAAPRVKILATSRERLNLREEWLFPVEGLDYPKDEGRRTRDQQTSTQSLIAHPSSFDSYSAVRLFILGAQRARSGFGLAPDDRPFVARLCQLVDGMPLAIELAANWVRILSCQEVAARMERGMDLLATSWRDLPARHRSIRVVFEQSWPLLSDEERAVFKRLTVFRGGFQLDAAKGVADANLRLLGSLVDKSFLRCDPVGRYDIHELLRQYGEEKLGTGDREETQARHSQYYAEFLAARQEGLNVKTQSAALGEIGRELENVRAAWNWAVDRQQSPEIEKMLLALTVFYDARGLQHEGEEAFRRAVDALGGAQRMFETPDRDQAMLLTRLIARQARFCDRLSRWEQGKELALQSLASARRLDAPAEVAASLSALSMMDSALGNYAAVREWAVEYLAVCRDQGDRRGEAAALQHLGDLERMVGNYAEAKELLAKGIAISEEIGNDELRGFGLIILGYVECALGDYADARKHGEEVVRVFQALANPFTTTHGYCILGQAALGVHAHQEAQTLFCRALEIARREQYPEHMLESLYWMAQLLTQKGETARAVELAALVEHHRATNWEWRERATKLLATMERQLPPGGIAAAREEAREAKLEEVVRKVLEDISLRSRSDRADSV